jgi:hypothetical protein
VWVLSGWQPIEGDVPLAAKDGGIDLAGLRFAAGGIQDCLRARSPRRRARLALELAEQLPSVLADPAENHKARA